MLVKTILKYQNPQRRAAHKEREAAAEAADPRIIQDQKMPTELKSAVRLDRAKKAPAKKKPAPKAQAEA
jgi:hypothetical protein